MPYITKEQVAEKRAEIRKELPSFKISVRRRDSMVIDVVLFEGPISMGDKVKGYQVNHYAIEQHFEDHPEAREVLLKIREIIMRGNGTLYEDADYGSVPNYYVHIQIGEWDRPYTVKN